MIELTSKQRKALEKQAQALAPVVMVGQNGITENVIAKTAESLASHELIKVKFIDFKEESKNLAYKLAESCDATLVRVIGFVAILYRQAEDEKKRHIKL